MRKPSYLIAAALLLSAAGEAIAGEIRKFPSQGIDTLIVDSAQGKVIVDGMADASGFEVQFGAFEDPENCEIRTETKNGDLKISARSKSKFPIREKCRIDITVKTPQTVALDVRLGAGSFAAKSMRGQVNFNIGSGDSVLSDMKLPELTGRTGSGDVVIDGQITAADLKVGAGDVRLTYDKVSDQMNGSLNVKVGSGSTTVLLPENSKIASIFKSGTGSLTNEFPYNDNAKFKISGSSGTGDMLIKKI